MDAIKAPFTKINTGVTFVIPTFLMYINVIINVLYLHLFHLFF